MSANNGKGRSSHSTGRPNQLGADKKIINFAVPYKQWKRSSEKSQAGRVFNVADFMRLLHKHLFINVSLQKAQALHRQLIALEKSEGEIQDVRQWLKDSAAGD
jgi:hypothetical protein